MKNLVTTLLNLLTVVTRLDGHYCDGSGLEGFFVWVGPVRYYVPVEKNPDREIEYAVYTVHLGRYYGDDKVSQARQTAVVEKIRAYCARHFSHIDSDRIMFRLRETSTVKTAEVAAA